MLPVLLAGDWYARDQAVNTARPSRTSPGQATTARMKVRDLGHGFIESALDAYHRRAITGSDLSEYLEIKLNRLPKLEAELAATGGARD
jgi:hypothetical protein